MIFVVPFGLIATLFHAIGFRKSMKQAVYRIAQGWGLAIIKISGCKVTVTGRENIPKKGGVCFVSNHCGYFDIVLLLAYSGRLVGFVAKKELIFIPFLNMWIYMLGGLFIDRSTPRKASRTINKGVERIKAGGGLIIFPEGHRSKGRGLLPFHPGSLKLATMAEAPIVPTVLEGSYEIFEKTKRFVKTDMKVTFCEPIETASLPSTDRKLILSDRIYSVINERMGK
ncbi:MAG: 1-acyl-sn-glycerol-3-phosphate acyltransferase [Treponema sp.]|nr:1-acyl-sn-glycerol-3-phosphate acyltransferase [Treponema sp.]